MANKALKEARKAYYKNQQTKGGQKKAQQNKSKVRKKKEKAVGSSWDSVREKTQTAGKQGEENRKNANIKKIARDNAEQAKTQTKSGSVKAVQSHYGSVAKKTQRPSATKSTTKFGKVVEGVLDAPVTSYAQHTAKNASDLAGWASKQAYRAKENQGRNRTHVTTRPDRRNSTQESLAQKQSSEQKKAKETINSKEFKAKQKEYVEPFKKTSKKMEKAQEKTLERGAKALGLSNEKKYDVPFVGKMSATDIYKSGNKVADELADYLIPYGGTTKGAMKAAEGILKASKAAKAGKILTETAETGGKVLSKDGKKIVREYAEKVAKGGDKQKALDDLFTKVKKSDFKQNVKKELIANAMQDATIGTAIDYAKGRQQGLEGKEFAKYMGENALLNAAAGGAVSALVGRTGKAGKNALKNEINTTTDQSLKAITEENRLARRLGDKGYSPQEVQNALSKQNVKDYIDLTVQKGKKTLTVEQQKHLDKLTAKVETQKIAYDNAINESVKATRESIGKASAIDVARLRRAVTHYETTGNTAAAKEARQLLKQAEKNFDNTLDTVTRAAANVSNALKREYKIESADEILESFAKTGGRVNDPSQFHGFAEFDKDGNIVGYHVNKDSEQALEFTFGHEFTHGFESLGKDYDDFVNDLKTFVGDEWDEAVEMASRDYANVKNADFEKEAVANLVAKHFFSEDSAYLKKLAGENPSMFSKIYNMIKKLLNGVNEHDTQFEALSKRMDEMFDSLSEKNKSIALGSPDSSEGLFAGGRTLQELIDDGINAEVAQGLREDLKAAKDSLLYAIKHSGGDYKEIAKARKQIYKDYGWFEGYDGKWRYEIDDSRMHYTLGKAIKTSVPNGKRLVFLDKNTGKIASASIDKVNEVETRLSELASKSKLTKKEANELQGLRTQMNLYLALTNPDGVPLGRVLTHDKFFELYPDAKDIKFKLSSSGDYADIKYDNVENATKEAISFGGYNREENTLTLNANMFAADSNLAKYIASTGKDPSEQIRRTTVHEMQHYIQDEEGFSRGANPEEYDYNTWEQFDNDAAATNSYPKNYERDADALEKLTDEKADIEADIESKFGIEEYDDFRAKYLPYMRDMTDEDLQYLGKQGYVEQAYRDLTTGDDPITVVNKEHEQLIKEYFEKDYDASQLAERDPQKVYKQAAGEVEAEDVAGRVNMSRSERKRNYPVQEGINVRYAEYPRSKGLAEKNLPKRKTKNETNLTRLSKGDNSEASYYDNLASGVDDAERELQAAQAAYSGEPVKGQMTDAVRAQVKAQKLDGKELTDAQVDTLAEAQVALHNTKVIIPESARTGTVKDIRTKFGLEEDNVMLPIVKSSTAKNAQSVADGYAALSKEFPDLFPSSITDEAEQFRRLMDISGLKGGAQSRRGNYYVPKNRTMMSSKDWQAVKKAEKPTQAEPKVEKTEPLKAKEKPTVEKPKAETPKKATTEKKGMIERERRDDTKKRENETAKKAFDTLNKEYGKDQGWVDAVTGKREDGAFGKLKVKGASEAAKTVDKEFNELGYDKLLKQYFKAEVADDPYVAMARANKLLGEIDRRLKSGDYEPSALYNEATDIIEKYSGITSLGSNILSSAKKFLTSTPQGRKRVVLKEIERLEKRYKDRIKGGKIVIDDAKIDELMHATGAKADELLDELNKEIWEQIPASLMERLNEYRHCFMLFNAKTHGRNVIGNGVFRMARALSDDMERGILNSNKARKRIGKMQGGKDPSDVIINRQKVTRQELKDNYMYLFNEFHAIYDKSGSRNKFIETGRPDGVPTVKFKPMQKLIDFNYKFLEKEDLKGALIPAFNKSYLSYCRARCPEGKDLRKFMEEMSNAQKEKARQYALAQGEYATFRDSCAFSDWLTAKKTTFAGQKGKTKWGTFGYRALDTVLEGAIPFVKTPVNIFRRSVDYSPASLIMSIGKLAKADSPEMFQLGVHQLCTGLTGTGMTGLGVFLATQGLITVRAGEESGDEYYDRDMGFQDYSLKIHLGDKEYSWTLDWMSPMNMSLFAGAAFEKIFEQKGFDNQTTLNAFFAITSPMTDMSFMSSPKDTVQRFMENAARNTEDGNPDFAGALAQLIVGDVPKNYVSGFFPQLMSQFAGVTDDYRRDTKSTRENVYLKGWESSYRQLVNKIPWAREYLLNPKVNRKGEDVKNDENIATRLINSFINPANVREITMDEDDRELINIRNHIKDKTSDLYTHFYYNFTGNPPYDLANGKRMTYDESYKYAKESRTEMNYDIKNMLHADSYSDMSWDMKANEVKGSYWIGKSVADKEVYGLKYAMNVLKNDDKQKSNYKTWETYKENAGSSASGETFWNYYIDKERLYNRSHPNGDNTYRVKGLPAIQSGDQALIDAVNLNGQKEQELTHYWEKAKKKYGKNAKEITNQKISDAVCMMTSNIDKAGVEIVGLGMQSASAAVSAKNGKKIDQDEYRALGQFWNSAQAGGGLQLKYNKDGKYDLKNLEKYSKQLDKKLDNRPDGVSQKDVACDFIENDLGITNVDEAACVFQVLYLQGHSNPASKNSWKNPYKDQIDDHLEWGDNKDGEWGGLEKGSGGGGRGWGRRRRGRGGSGGGKGKMPTTDTGAIKGKVTNPFSTSNGSSASNLNDAYRKKAKQLREQMNKRK